MGENDIAFSLISASESDAPRQLAIAFPAIQPVVHAA